MTVGENKGKEGDVLERYGYVSLILTVRASLISDSFLLLSHIL